MKKNIYYFAMVSMAIMTFACQTFADEVKTNEWGETTNGLQMSISLKDYKEEIKTNQSVVLLVRFKNVSTNETFRIYQANAVECDPSYSWVIILPSGMNISPQIPFGISGGFFRLAPNQIKEAEYNLSYLYKFNEVGTYKIIAKKGISSSKKYKKFDIVSNTLNVTVVSGQ